MAGPSPTDRIGWIQGRLTEPVDGRIQAFPVKRWREEFSLGAAHGFRRMAWVVGEPGFDENPLMTAAGVDELTRLAQGSGVRVDSVLADILMHKPFFRRGEAERRSLAVFTKLIEQTGAARIPYLEVPLVDNAHMADEKEESRVARILAEMSAFSAGRGVALSLELDLSPARAREFLRGPGLEKIRLNFDMGDSASYGHDVDEEIAVRASRLSVVHVKDRPRGGTTVAPGLGAVDFPRVFAALEKAGYEGPYLLQTARDPGRDLTRACEYRDRVAAWLEAA